MSQGVTLKHATRPATVVVRQRPIKLPGPRHPRTPEAAIRRREFALLMRSIRTLVRHPA